MRVHAVTWPEGEHYVSRCVGANVASQGSTAEEAEANLAEALTLSGVVVPEDQEPPRLTVLDVQTRVVSPADYEDVDGAALLRELESSGWTLEEQGAHVVLTKHGRAVVVPLADRIAPGVYHVVRARIAEAMAEETAQRREAFAKLDALFAANPWEGDVTQIIREMRDSR
jgi:predicted RNase H-like HicB family nuclease/antitoxin (DNA-binding transcriptional repressor) of toxin-antitoxin stability system